jgi:hypothetical protein
MYFGNDGFSFRIGDAGPRLTDPRFAQQGQCSQTNPHPTEEVLSSFRSPQDLQSDAVERIVSTWVLLKEKSTRLPKGWPRFVF